MDGKEAAGRKAIDEIREGMTVGLGTGSTVYYFLQVLAEKVAEGLSITGVATSQKTVKLATEWQIPMKPLNSVDQIDITIDGADECDPSLNGIKGGGGALLYEKLVAKASKKRVWIVDSRKEVEQLGSFPLPIEVIPFGWKQVRQAMENKGYRPELRLNEQGEPFVTDAHHYILDLHLRAIQDPASLAAELDHVTGIVEHGLFVGMTDEILIGYPDGHVGTLSRKDILRRSGK
nr:ribose-5-phosphate isomerase RpiA [Sporolactobacillus pectinivorans]